MEVKDKQSLKDYLFRCGRGYLKNRPLARYEDVREHLMSVNMNGNPEGHPAFAHGFLSEWELKRVVQKVFKFERKYRNKLKSKAGQQSVMVRAFKEKKTASATKNKRKVRFVMSEKDFKEDAMHLAKVKYGKDYHPLGLIFPFLPSEELSALCEGLKAGGSVTVYTLNGLVLEGKNLLLAAAVVGLEVVFIEYEGDAPLEFVLNQNLRRRHLSASQRAYAAAKLVTTKLGSNQHEGKEISGASMPEVTQADAAQMFNVSVATLGHAQAVLSSGDEALIKELSEGKIKAYAAYDKLKRVSVIPDAKGLLESSVFDEKKAFKVIKGFVSEERAADLIAVMKADGKTDAKTFIGAVLEAYYEAHKGGAK